MSLTPEPLAHTSIPQIHIPTHRTIAPHRQCMKKRHPTISGYPDYFTLPVSRTSGSPRLGSPSNSPSLARVNGLVPNSAVASNGGSKLKPTFLETPAILRSVSFSSAESSRSSNGTIKMKHKAHLMLGNPESKMGSGSSSGESTVCPSTASSDEMEAMRLGLSNGEENRVAFRRALGIVGGRRAKGTPYPVTRMDANSWLDEEEDDEETDEVGDGVKAVTIE